MRTIIIGLALLAAAMNASAQFNPVSWFTLDGGGGTSIGGRFALSGTIGQPDAATSSGGWFSLSAGFWSVESLVVETPGFPRLAIRRQGDDVIISYVSGETGLVLQNNSTLSPAGWADLPNGRTNLVRLPASGTAQFYRLRR